MNGWPKYNVERHVSRHYRIWCLDCGIISYKGRFSSQCTREHPCRCCETARADEAERALAAQARTLAAVREIPTKDGVTEPHPAMYFKRGWNAALDAVKQALDGGAE